VRTTGLFADWFLGWFGLAENNGLKLLTTGPAEKLARPVIQEKIYKCLSKYLIVTIHVQKLICKQTKTSSLRSYFLVGLVAEQSFFLL